MLIPLGILDFPTGAAGAYELIESNILTSSASSVTFSSIPSDYKHLQIRYTARTNGASTWDELFYYFNGDTTGANYARHRLQGDGSSVGVSSSTSFAWAGLSAANSSPASSYAGGVSDILDYSNSSKFTTTRTLSGAGETDTAPHIVLHSSLWENTAAITSITLDTVSTDQIQAGSRFSLYGIRG